MKNHLANPKSITILVIILLISFATALNAQTVKQGTEESFYTVVEKMPMFPGGEKELLKFISHNLKYPVVAQENGIQGKVILRFVVLMTGKVSNIEVLRSLDPSCDKEAVRVIKMLPDWIPGEQNGEKVSVWYTLPITYKLAGDNKNPLDDEKFRRSIVCILDGVQQPIGFDMLSIKSENISDIEFWKPDTTEFKESLIAKYGESAKNGVFSIKTKKVAIDNADSIQKIELDEKIYSVIEQMPIFPGGDSKLSKFIDRNTKYPVEAQEWGTQGVVVLRFVVTKTGKINRVEVVRSLSRECDKEAIRVVGLLPDFIPGKQNGRNVAVWYTVPVYFKLL